MSTARRVRPALTAAGLAVSLTAAGLLTGCGLLDRAQPTTTGTSSSGAPQAPPTTTEDLGTLTGAGRPLGREQLESVLPSASEVADGWEDDPQETVFETTGADVDPSKCASLIQKGPGWDEAKATQRARAQANYRAKDNTPPPGTQRSHLVVWAYSFDSPYPSRLLDEAGEVVAECSRFTVRQPDTGRSSTYEAEPLGFPVLGDRTVAYRLTAQQSVETTTMDYVVVKVGHNTFTVVNATYNGTPNVGITEQTARATLAGLEDA